MGGRVKMFPHLGWERASLYLDKVSFRLVCCAKLTGSMGDFSIVYSFIMQVCRVRHKHSLMRL